MKSVFSRGKVLVFSILTIFLLLAWSVRKLASGREIHAEVSASEIELGKPIFFVDSTYKTYKVVWEFGNGDFSQEKRGRYVFPEVGKYQIRLTVDNCMEKFFVVKVRERRMTPGRRPIRIIAPKRVLQNERVIFMADGDSKDWRWEFGESGDVDSQDRNPIYADSQPGCYEIRLRTETTKYPVVHQVEVLPEYTESDSSDVMTLIAVDIQEHLQNIVDKGSFNANYNYILKKYLHDNPNVMVLVNSDKENDFYSYCYGLKIVGRQYSTTINEVVVETDKNASCVRKLLINQNSIKEKP